jgi:hypothetical protein
MRDDRERISSSHWDLEAGTWPGRHAADAWTEYGRWPGRGCSPRDLGIAMRNMLSWIAKRPTRSRRVCVPTFRVSGTLKVS